MLLLRVLARLIGLLLLAILALAGAAIAVFSIRGGTVWLSTSQLAHLLHLPGLRDTVGAFLHGLESPGPIAAIAAIGGAGTILLGLALLAGAVVPRRERLLIIEVDDDEKLALQRRAAAQAIRSLAEQPREIERATAKIRPRRTGTGGRARVTLYRGQADDGPTIISAATACLKPLSDELSLRVRARSRVTRNARRVR